MTEKLERVGITIRSLTVAIVAVILASIIWVTCEVLSPYPSKNAWLGPLFWPGGNAWTMVLRNYWYGALLMTIYPVLFNLLLPKRLKLNSAELVFVASVMMPLQGLLEIGDASAGVGQSIGIVYGGLAAAVTKGYVEKYVSPLFGPVDYNLLVPMTTGRATVPWGPWIPAIAWYIMFYLSFFILVNLIGALVRRLWVDIEYLGFPLATFVITCINQTAADKKEEQSFFKSPFFWTGFLITFLMLLLVNLDKITGLAPVRLLYDFTPLGILTGVWVLVLNPVALGLGMYMPDNVLVTTSVAFIIMYMILPATVWVPLGFIDPAPPGRDNFWTFNRFIGKFEFKIGTPLRGGYMPFMWGILLGLAIYPLFTNWRYFKNVFGAIAGKKVEGEEEEPLPYRYTWFGIIICSVIFIAALAMVNVPPHYAIVELFLMAIFYAGLARYQAEAAWGCTLHGGWGEWVEVPYQAMLFPLGLADNPQVATPWMATTTTLVSNGGWTAIGVAQVNPGGWSLESYRVGSEFRARNKDLLLVQILALVIPTVIAIPLYLWLLYTYGSVPTRIALPNNMLWYFSYRVVTEKTLHNPIWAPDASMIGNYIWGVVFVFLIYFLRKKVGGIFNYASAAALLVTAMSGNNVWLAFLVAFLVKFLVQKIGGPPLTRKITLPLGAGLLIAGAVNVPLNLFGNWIAKIAGIIK